MEQKDYLQQLHGIQGMLEERTRYRSLSGLSGVLAGVFALIGAYTANQVIYSAASVAYKDMREDTYSAVVEKLILIALVTLACAVGSVLLLSARNARKNNASFWSSAARKLLVNFSIPMAMGGIFVFALLWKGYFGLVAPSCLIFYGLGLVNASHYTYSDIKTLGIVLLITGSIALFFPGRGLWLWAFGFGVLHIVYGAIMYFKYEK